MIVIGICLLIIAAWIPKLAILWGIGTIVPVVGVILAVLGTMDVLSGVVATTTDRAERSTGC